MKKPLDVLLHQTREGERWDSLAYLYYGDPHAIGRLAEANPHLDLAPLLPTGTIVLIPVVDQADAAVAIASSELPPWKR